MLRFGAPYIRDLTVCWPPREPRPWDQCRLDIDIFASSRYLIDVDTRAFAIWHASTQPIPDPWELLRSLCHYFCGERCPILTYHILLPMCQNTTMRVNGAWIDRYCILCSKTYNTLHSCHNFPASSRKDGRGGGGICETSLLEASPHPKKTDTCWGWCVLIVVFASFNVLTSLFYHDFWYACLPFTLYLSEMTYNKDDQSFTSS